MDKQQVDEFFEHYRLEVDPKQSALRIDKFLMDRLKGISRSKVQEAIRFGQVLVNVDTVKPNYKVRPGDVINVFLPDFDDEDYEVIPQKIPLNIVFEDEEILVINKEAGMVVHPGYKNYDGTLVNALAYRFNNLPTTQNGEGKPGLVHRIDKDTSGLLVIAKTEKAMSHLARQFYDHTIERTYNALVWGEVKEDSGTIEGNIGRSLKDRRVSVVFEDPLQGKPAVTHYKVLGRLRYISLVQCNLETGRTHQIRVHMKHIGHALFNDKLYGGDRILKGERFSKYKEFVENCFKIMPRQGLHAKSLGFIHPATGKYMQFTTVLPDDFTQVLQRWEKYVQYH